MRVARALAAAGLARLGLAAWEVWQGGHDPGGRFDAAIVLGAAQRGGAPSRTLLARILAAEALWRAGRVRFVAVTGGVAPEETLAEAAVSAAVLRLRGVPESALLSESDGHNTRASFEALAPVLREAGVRSVLAVSDPWHLARCCLYARRLGFEAAGSPAQTPRALDPLLSMQFFVEEVPRLEVAKLTGH